MNSTPNRAGRGDTFESRLLQALTEVDAPPRWSRLYWRRW